MRFVVFIRFLLSVICAGFLQRSRRARTLAPASFVSDTFWFASDLPGRNAPYIPGRATVIQLWGGLPSLFSGRFLCLPLFFFGQPPVCRCPKNRLFHQLPKTALNLGDSVEDGLLRAVVFFQLGDLGHSHLFAEELMYKGLLGNG